MALIKARLSQLWQFIWGLAELVVLTIVLLGFAISTIHSSMASLT